VREVGALIRAHWLTATSYRVRTLLSLAGLAAMVVPLIFVAGALQPVVEESIRAEGRHYFAFLVIGMLSVFFIAAALDGLATALGDGIRTGTLEALLTTPGRLPMLVLGLTGYGFLWAALRAAVLLVAGVALGVSIAWGQAVLGLGILLLIVLAYLPFGLISAAAVLAWRTPTPLGQGVMAASVFLGGVYYSTTVIPSWLQDLSSLVPLTYGLRALRRTMLDGAPFLAVAQDVFVLAAFAVTALALGLLVFHHALGYARRAGTLSQY
jgi:ABC-2 type transport system permease protein